MVSGITKKVRGSDLARVELFMEAKSKGWMDTLDPFDRELIEAVFSRGVSRINIATALGFSVYAVEKHVNDAVGRLVKLSKSAESLNL